VSASLAGELLLIIFRLIRLRGISPDMIYFAILRTVEYDCHGEIQTLESDLGGDCVLKGV
jgi:hypothetical protein